MPTHRHLWLASPRRFRLDARSLLLPCQSWTTTSSRTLGELFFLHSANKKGALASNVDDTALQTPLCFPIGYSGWDSQAYNVPQSWITTPNTFDWHTGVQDHINPNNYIPPETHVGWLEPVLSTPLGGFELSRNDAALQDLNNYWNITLPEVGYTER